MKFEFGRTVPPHERLRVSWYQPSVLLTAAREVVSSLDQLRNRDPRENLRLPLTVIDRSDAPAGEDFWFDFIADTGDGGNATYAVAHAALADELLGDAGETTLPRGELLLLGGDLAYPSASPDDYRYRFIEMFEGARRDADAVSHVRGRRFTLAALPQNHDWMDSATTFSRYFIRNKDSTQFLGADIPQQQSYFCVKLPHGWWILGLDFALTHDMDRDQYEQFLKLDIAATDRIIMVYPEPYWTRPVGDTGASSLPKRYQRLEGWLGTRIKLRLAGDLHHYMRWTSQSQGQLVTCGTGGAFTHPTHTRQTTRTVVHRVLDTSNAIPKEGAQAVALGLDDETKPQCEQTFERREASVYPDQRTSRARIWGNVPALFRRDGARSRGTLLPSGNFQFAVLMGCLYWFNAYLNSTPFAASFAPDRFAPMWEYPLSRYGVVFVLWLKAMVFSPMGLIINALMVAACVVMGREASDEVSPASSPLFRGVVTIGMGLLHAFVHVIAIYSLTFLLQQLVGCITFLGIGRPRPMPPWRASHMPSSSALVSR